MNQRTNAAIRRMNRTRAHRIGMNPRVRNIPNKTANTTRLAFSMLVTVVLGSGCDQQLDEPELSAYEHSDEIVSNLLAAGYDESDIEIREGGRVVLQGDIAVSLASSKRHAGDRFRQATFSNIVKSGTIYLRNGSCTFRKVSNFTNALSGARSTWNAQLPSLSIEEWTPGVDENRTITVVKSNSVPASQFAEADEPESSSIPGKQIRVNAQTATLSKDQIQYVLTHEMGHAIGMAHTDWNTRWSCGSLDPEGSKEGIRYEDDDGNIVETPSCDPKSIMNACPTELLTDFSDWDKFSIGCVFGSCPSSVPAKPNTDLCEPGSGGS